MFTKFSCNQQPSKLQAFFQHHFSNKQIKGILFDVDGTLYHQSLLRMFMICNLLVEYNFKLTSLLQVFKVIVQFRKAQETLRLVQDRDNNNFVQQLNLTALNTGESVSTIKDIVHRWFEVEPCKYLKRVQRKDLARAIREFHATGFRLGVYSDYPAQEKLQALNLNRFFPIVISSMDEKISGFKPLTNGFTIAAKKMRLSPQQILYIGDRLDVDARGAHNVGMPCLIVGGVFKTHYKRVV